MTRIRTAIIDYKMGNIWSLTNALDYLKKDYQLISEPDKLRHFTHILLPGVGSAREAFERLSSSGFAEKIKECVSAKKDENFKISGQNIFDILTVNGIRFTLEDGSWG